MDFTVLADLVKIINKNKVKDATTLNDLGHLGKNLTKLYQGLLTNAFASDEEAAQALYGKGSNNPSYKRTRHKLFNLLVNTVFFIDTNQPRYTDNEKALGECYRGFVAAQLFFRNGGKNGGIYLLKIILEQSIKYEFTFLTTEILRTLRQGYITSYYSVPEIRKITKLLQAYEDKHLLEIEVRRLMESLQEGFVSGRIGSKVIQPEVEEQYLRYATEMERVDTANFRYMTYVIGIIFYQSRNDIAKVLEICSTGITQLKDNKAILKGQLASLAINQLTCFAHLKIFDTPEVEQSIGLCNYLTLEGNPNWFKINEIVAHHYIHAERYNDALDLYEKSVQHPRYALIPEGIREPWRVFAGYFHLLASLGAIDNDLVMQKVGPIKVEEFEYDFKQLKSVKHGMNVPVLMLPVYFKALEGALDEYGRSAESLRKYVDRHLRKRGVLRSVAMINLLVALDRYPYQPRAAKSAITKHLEEFVKTPVELSEQSSAIEIVPYEKLWVLLLRYRRVYL